MATARAASRSLIPAALGVVVAAGLAATLGRRAAPGGERGPMIVAAVAAGAAGVIAVAGAVAAGRASLDAACEMYFVDDVAGGVGGSGGSVVPSPSTSGDTRGASFRRGPPASDRTGWAGVSSAVEQ